MADTLGRFTTALEGRYRIERELGAGGMATVYLAEDLRHHRGVAIKVLRQDLAASLGAERFLREIEIAARLSHPHILPSYDSGGVGDVLFRRHRRRRITIQTRLPGTSPHGSHQGPSVSRAGAWS